MNPEGNRQPIIEIKDLSVSFPQGIHPLRNIHLELYPGEALVLLGESGAGKSLLCKTLFGLEVYTPDMKVTGKILGKAKTAMIFQDPSQYLHPRVSIRRHLIEFLRIEEPQLSPEQTQEKMFSLMNQVGLPGTQDFLERKTGELSGGQQQRVMISLALSQKPQLLIADEPLGALDTNTKARILDLLKKLQVELGLSILMVTHDLGATRHLADRIVVLYAGSILELASKQEFFKAPQHPYSRGLLGAHPGPELRNQKLFEIPGTMPPPDYTYHGCIFAARCEFKKQICHTNPPHLVAISEGHHVSCHMITQPELWKHS